MFSIFFPSIENSNWPQLTVKASVLSENLASEQLHDYVQEHFVPASNHPCVRAVLGSISIQQRVEASNVGWCPFGTCGRDRGHLAVQPFHGTGLVLRPRKADRQSGKGPGRFPLWRFRLPKVGSCFFYVTCQLVRHRVRKQFYCEWRLNGYRPDGLGARNFRSTRSQAMYYGQWAYQPTGLKSALEIIKANGRYAGIVRETPTGPFVNLNSPGVPAPAVTPGLPEQDATTPEGQSAQGQPAIAPPGVVLPTFDAKTNRVFISHGKQKAIVVQIKELLNFGNFEPVVSVEREVNRHTGARKSL